jgi:hypothetical protein
MFELVSKMPCIIPKSLFMTNVETAKTMIAIGGYGRVFKGVYKRLPVALKVVDKGHTNVSAFLSFVLTTMTYLIRTHLVKTFAEKLLHGDHSRTILSFPY